MRTYSIVFINIFFLCCISCFFQNCAVQIPPSGGPRDSLPPVLVSATIKDSTTNFKASNITFKFNEYIDGTDLANAITINPLPVRQPTVTTRLNSFTISLRDSLLPNTTYTLKVKNGVKDLNEGNKIETFNYLFTTGNSFDNGKVTGSIYNASTGAVDSTLTVMLYKNITDSAVALENPIYITDTDGDGKYTFNNIAPGKYALYAYEATKGSYMYNNTDKKFAFYDSTIIVANNIIVENKDLYAFVQEKELPPASTINNNKPTEEKNADKRLKFTTDMANNTQGLLDNLTLTFNRPIISIDTAFIKMVQGNNIVASKISIDTTDHTKINIETKWKEDAKYSLLIEKPFVTDTTKVQYYRQKDTLDFTTKKLIEYGSLEITFNNIPKGTVLLELKKGEAVVNREYISGNRFFIKTFEPGEYSAQLIIDNNKNKKWDTGNYFKGKKQPEKVIPIKETLGVRANFDKSYNIKL
jgi:hypothetical protein